MVNCSAYIWCRSGYLWLLQQPSILAKNILEMCASGIFGSTLVTGIIYFVEYTVQNRINIHKLLDMQRNYVRKFNEITFISGFGNEVDDIARLAYIEYANNCFKLYEYRENANCIKNKYMSKKEKEEKLAEKYPKFEHKKASEYKEFVWKQLSEKRKNSIEQNGYKKVYLENEFEGLVKNTNLEIMSAFYDYQDIYNLDISEIRNLVDEIQFIGPGKNKKTELVGEIIKKNGDYVEIINDKLLSLFPVLDVEEYNRELLLSNIETIQYTFFNQDCTESKVVEFYLNWKESVKREILHEKKEKDIFEVPRNSFKIEGGEAKFKTRFIKKVKEQDWDYKRCINLDLKELEY